MKKLLISVLISLLVLTSFQTGNEDTKRFYDPSFSNPVDKTIPHIIEFNDTIPNKTLIEYRDKNGFPVKYSREIITGVCIDGECRMVSIVLFWNNTGRYLGFELPNGEFLSKTEHVKFNPQEYDRLHQLLADPLSALANYSLKELVPEKDSIKTKVDAVSSATIAAVLDYIVTGAVYTTYTLWHIVYGPTKREIEKITAENLNSEFAMELLNSKYLEDKVWTLNKIAGNQEISDNLLSKLIELISGDDVYLAERSLNALKTENLTAKTQIQLSNIFEKSGFLTKRLIIQKLGEASELDESVKQKLSQALTNLNGTMVKQILELFQTHQIDEEEVSANIAMLLENENRYISVQALKYLEQIENMDKKTIRMVEKHRRKMQ